MVEPIYGRVADERFYVSAGGMEKGCRFKSALPGADNKDVPATEGWKVMQV